jgi:hypothetical protein
VLHEQTVRRVLALGQALGLEPLHVPLQPEAEAATTPEPPTPDAEPKP